MNWEWPIRIALSLGLSGILGFEREARHKSAGMRTHMLVGMGATLFTLVSVDFPGGDPARVAAQVVTGVGFLGAGVIFRQGATVRGLTTAANLWVVAAIGVVAGLGRLAEAALVTAIAFGVLGALRSLDRMVGGKLDGGEPR
jgi:putative Mg2+ transporter-C (MgtC) family protein